MHEAASRSCLAHELAGSHLDHNAQSIGMVVNAAGGALFAERDVEVLVGPGGDLEELPFGSTNWTVTPPGMSVASAVKLLGTAMEKCHRSL